MAVGLTSAMRAFGVLTLLVVYGGLWLFAVVMVWGLTLEAEIARSSVLRISLLSTLGVVVVAGLCELHPQYGLLTALVIGLTSPAALGLTARLAPRLTSQPVGSGPPRVLVDPVTLDRRFHDIVDQLRRSGDFPET